MDLEIESTEDCGGARVDEMLPPELLAELIKKLTRPTASVLRGRNMHTGLRVEMLGLDSSGKAIQDETR